MALYRTIVLSAYIIFLCNMAISYHHALELFRHQIGFPGWFAHVAVVGVDTLFAVSSLVISNAITKQIKVGGPVWLAFSVGFAFTEWSNVRACWNNGLEGIIVGSAPVFALLCIKFLLSWMVANREAFASSHNASDSHSVRVTHASSHTHALAQADSHTLTHTESHNESHTQDSHTRDSHTHSHEVSQTDSHMRDSHARDSHTSSQSHTHEDSRVRGSHKDSHTHDESHNVQESHKDSHTESHTQESHTQESHKKESLTDTQPREPRDPREVALEIYNKTGDLPSIRGLMAEAVCKEWPARKTLQQLRKELGLEEPKKRKRMA